MKPMLTVVMVLSLCLSQQAWAGSGVGPTGDADGLDARTVETGERSSTFQFAPWTDQNIHDPGITILEAFRRAARWIHRALVRFGDGIRGRIPFQF